MPAATFRTAAFALLAAAVTTSPVRGLAALEPEGKAEATLEMSVRKLDWAGNKAMGLMYMPSGSKVTADKPDGVRKEPKYRGTPKYATVTLGNGAKNTYAIAFDEPEGQDARIFADLNGDGDLTNDGDGAWETKNQKEGEPPSYSTTSIFEMVWKNAEGAESRGQYGLNFYRSPDRDSVNYYRSSARVGKVKLGGKEYEVTLIENDNDGLFNKLYDPAKPLAAESMPKPVWLTLDGDRLDIRGTFGFGDYNYIARVSDDGSKLSLEPTMKTIRLPRPTERPQMLGAGGPVPAFEAQIFDAAAPDATPKTFAIGDFKGKKIVVIDMWATWCGPCKASIPHLSKLAEDVKSQDVEVIALNVLDDKAAFERYLRDNGKKYAFSWARDPAGRESELAIPGRLFKVSGIPAMYVIDKSGKIAASISGYREGDRQIEQALVNLGVKIEGMKPVDPAAEKPKMIPATGMGK